MTDWDNLANATAGLLGVAIVVDVASKALDKLPKPKKGDKIKW